MSTTKFCKSRTLKFPAQEINHIRKEFIKITFKMNPDEIADNKQKIIDKLLRKGYKYQTIIKIMEENNGK